MNRVKRSILLTFVILALLLAWAPPAHAARTHVVQRGETLFRIALKYGVTVPALRSANGIRGDLIYAGQTLIIPDANAPVAAQASVSSTGGVHIVRAGETLFKIGLKYGINWRTIQSANGLAGTRIYAGQRLVIPGAGGATAPVAAPQPAPAPAQPAASGDGKRFLIDLSEQRLYAYEGDTLVRSTLVSTGIARYPTVVGTFRIYLRYTSARMRGPGYDLPGVPYVMYFYKGYGLHGTYWHSNFGTPMSHGCVNMPTSEAEWAFNWSTYGTPVTVQR